MGNFHIHLLQVGTFNENLITETAEHLTRVFPRSYSTVGLCDPSILKDAYNKARRQYHSSMLLLKVGEFTKTERAERVLAIVDVDLYVPRLNFVFGEAQCPGRLAVISTYRLKPEFYGEVNGLLRGSRVKKEATHELGHTLGVGHCVNPVCVMYFSNSIADTDRKGESFCQSCDGEVHEALGRYRLE